MRIDGRKANQLRMIELIRNVSDFAEGSASIRMGKTLVRCTATVETQLPRWRNPDDGGWVTGDYDMLPRANRARGMRNSGRGGREREISRLLGRSLRAVVDLKCLRGLTITLDCDVLQGDGGTRTAAINGGFVALVDALRWCEEKRLIKHWPLADTVAAVSAGLVEREPLLDLCYEEDSAAEVDANFVLTGKGQLVEVQMSGEEAVFSEQDMLDLLELARRGAQQITRLQRQVLGPFKVNKK